MSFWQLIENADRETSTPVQLWNGVYVFTGWFLDGEGWVDERKDAPADPQPTHFQPLALPPNHQAGTGGAPSIETRRAAVDCWANYKYSNRISAVRGERPQLLSDPELSRLAAEYDAVHAAFEARLVEIAGPLNGDGEPV